MQLLSLYRVVYGSPVWAAQLSRTEQDQTPLISAASLTETERQKRVTVSHSTEREQVEEGREARAVLVGWRWLGRG